MRLFRKAATPPPPPTSPVVVRSYDTSNTKGLSARLNAAYGIDDGAVAGITAAFEYDANELARYGYLPVAQAWAGRVAMFRGPALTVTYVRQAAAIG